MDARFSQSWTSVNLVLLALACNLAAGSGARLLIWTPLLFLAPGYLISSALFRKDRLGAILIGALLSICLEIIGGLLLGFFGQINLAGWSVWFCFIFASCFFIRDLIGADALTPCSPERSPQQVHAGGNSYLAMALAIWCALVGGAYWMAIRSEAADSQFSFIEFWLLPGDISSELALGVTNEEVRAQAFRIEVSTDGVTTAAWTTGSVEPGQTIQSKISVAPAARRVTAKLFRREDPAHVLRSVSRDVKSSRMGEPMR